MMRQSLASAARARVSFTRVTTTCVTLKKSKSGRGYGHSCFRVGPRYLVSLDRAQLYLTLSSVPMPKTIAAPFPHVQANSEPRAREHTRAAKPFERTERIDARVSALEARWEETVPTLATSVDISDIRSELRGVENRLIVWILGAAGTLLLSLLGIFFAGYNSLNTRIDSAVAELRTETRSSILELKDETRSSIAELRAELRETNARMEARFERMDAKFDALMAELRSQRSDSR